MKHFIKYAKPTEEEWEDSPDLDRTIIRLGGFHFIFLYLYENYLLGPLAVILTVMRHGGEH